MLNPWFLAAGLMALVGIFQEIDEKEKGTKKALPGPSKETKPATPVTVNVGQAGVQSKKEPKQKEPSAKVPKEPSGDG